MKCSNLFEFHKPLFLPPTKFSHLPDYAFKRFLEGEANSTNTLNLESQRKYPCPPTIDQILDRNSYNPPSFLDNLISAANEQAKRKPSRNHYIEAGGWILLSSNGKQYRYLIKPEEEQDYGTGVFLTDREIQKYAGKYLSQGWIIVAEFHTHPDSGNTVGIGDNNRSIKRGIPGFIIDINGKTFKYGITKGIYGIGIPKGCE